MFTLHFGSALLPSGWADDVQVVVTDGTITKVTIGAAPEADDERHQLAIPGISSLHSHAFQRGMAGLAETRGNTADTFWTWRETMYRFALEMTPEDAEAVATLLYVEMLEQGYTRVGEFHYLHHDHDGTPYANPAEMATRIMQAADVTGIGLTLLPSFYAHGSFGGAAPHAGQRRFICSVDQFAKLIVATRAAVRELPGANVGIAPHSLRAVTPDELAAIVPLAATDLGYIFTKQLATNQILVNDGETAVIGGLTVTEVKKTRSGIPLLSALPIVGKLFSYSDDEERRRDLIILVTPRIIDDGQAPAN